MGLGDSLRQLREKFSRGIARDLDRLAGDPDSASAPCVTQTNSGISMADTDVAAAGFPAELRPNAED